MLEYLFGGVAGDGEADALVAAVVAGDGDVDAHDAAMLVEERAAGIAGVDGGVGLEQFDHVEHAEKTALGADHALGHRLPQSKRAAHGQRPIADLHVLVAVGEWCRQIDVLFETGRRPR